MNFTNYTNSLPQRLKIILKILAIFLITRIAIFLIAYIYGELTQDRTHGAALFQSQWAKWDTRHYLNIAEHGYVSEGDDKYLIVFFPLYPTLIWFVNIILNNYFLSAIAISNISLFSACIFLYKLVRIDFDQNTAFRAVLLFLISPLTFFFSIAYTEGLYVFFSIASFYYMRKSKWLIASLIGFLAALTRNLGLLLIITIAIEFIVTNNVYVKLKRRKFSKINKLLPDALSIALIPMGTFTYLYLNKIVTGELFTFMQYQSEHWYHQTKFFLLNIFDYFQKALFPTDKFQTYIWIPLIIFLILTTLTLIIGIRKIRISYTLYSLANIVAIFSITWLISGPRYMMSIFPLFIIWAIILKNKFSLIIFSAISISALIFLTHGFITNQAVM